MVIFKSFGRFFVISVLLTFITAGRLRRVMKHHPKVVAVLLGLFLLSQFLGLAILQMYIDPVKSMSEGKVVSLKSCRLGERPPLEEETSYVPMMVAVLIGTVVCCYLLNLIYISVESLVFNCSRDVVDDCVWCFCYIGIAGLGWR